MMKANEGLKKQAGGRSLIGNSLWMLTGQGISVIAQAGYFIAIARLLGSTEYGAFVGAAASVGLFSQYGSFGAGLLFLRYVCPDHNLFGRYWGNILLSTAIFGSVPVAVLAGVSPWILRHSGVELVVLLAIGDCICGQLVTCSGQVFQAFEKMKYSAVLNTLSGVTRMVLAGVLLFVLHHANALMWASASLAVSIVTAVAAVGIITLKFGMPRFDLALFRSRLREGFVFAVSGATTSVYNDVDKAMMAHYGMSSANGVYAMAYRVVDIGTMPIRSIHAAAFPRFFKKGKEADGLTQTKALARKILAKTCLIGLGINVALFCLAPTIPLIAGAGFGPSVLALRWLCLIPFLRAFHLSAGDALAGAGRQTTRLAMQMIAAGFNVGVNLWLIPHYGWRGAAWASLATDATLGVLAWTVLSWTCRQRMKAGFATEGDMSIAANQVLG